MHGLMWLASYPKSGNTWTRAVLTCYFAGPDAPIDLTRLAGTPVAGDRALFDETLGIASSDLAEHAIIRLRRPFHRQLATDNRDARRFIKTHDAYRDPNGTQLFFPESTRGAVYLVRNPLDVVVSYAHHLRWDLDRIVAALNRDVARLGASSDAINAMLPQFAGSWRSNVASWTEQHEVPVHVVRYEDALADPAAAFGGIVRFVCGELNEERLAAAVEQTTFRRLQEAERAVAIDGDGFFRAGRAGDWREALSPAQVDAVVHRNDALMARFDYLADV